MRGDPRDAAPVIAKTLDLRLIRTHQAVGPNSQPSPNSLRDAEAILDALDRAGYRLPYQVSEGEE